MDIQNLVIQDLKKILDETEIEKIIKNIHFYYGNGGYEPGIYVYEENEDYHYIVVGDRGGIDAEIKTSNIEIILYRLYSNITFNKATKFAMLNREKDKDWRRLIFSKQLELLRGISDVYYEKRAEEIRNILLTSPYKDDM